MASTTSGSTGRSADSKVIWSNDYVTVRSGSRRSNFSEMMENVTGDSPVEVITSQGALYYQRVGARRWIRWQWWKTTVSVMQKRWREGREGSWVQLANLSEFSINAPSPKSMLTTSTPRITQRMDQGIKLFKWYNRSFTVCDFKWWASHVARFSALMYAGLLHDCFQRRPGKKSSYFSTHLKWIFQLADLVILIVGIKIEIFNNGMEPFNQQQPSFFETTSFPKKTPA